MTSFQADKKIGRPVQERSEWKEPRRQKPLALTKVALMVRIEKTSLYEISRSPARLCPPRQKHYGPIHGPTDRRTDIPSYRVVAHNQKPRLINEMK